MTNLIDAIAELNLRVHILYCETEIVAGHLPDDEWVEHFDTVVESDPRCNRLVRRIDRLEIAYPEVAA